MRKLFLVLTVIVIFGASGMSNCRAEEPDSRYWICVATDNDGFRSYFYLPDIKKNRKLYEANNNTQYFRIWGWQEEINGKYTKLLVEFDLFSEKFTILDLIEYAKDGSVIGRGALQNNRWDFLVPETVGWEKFEALKLLICY